MQLKCNDNLLVAELIEQCKFFQGYDSLNLDIEAQCNGSNFSTKITLNGQEYVYSYTKEYFTALEQKRYYKRFAKLSLYKTLSSYFNVTLPWGALTGIRPVKFAYQEGQNYYDFMRNLMGVSNAKMSIVDNIIASQKGIYELNEQNFDLFVGIPFCPSKCLYCSFVSSVISSKSPIDEYVSAVVLEIEKAKPIIKNLRSVYIGGGTPISLPPSQLERILVAIGDNGVEYTVEAGRPDCMTEEIMQLLKKYNVTRICVNPQTLNDRTLEILGRNHTSQQIYDSFILARQYGFDINMDIIAGLPGEDFAMFKHTVDECIRLKPENITVHTLSLKKGSRLKEMVERLSEKQVEQMVDYAHEALHKAGYSPYYLYRQKYQACNLENTGYALAGKACVYNVDIMEEVTNNIACGANSVSKAMFLKDNRLERYGSPKDIKTYIDKIDVIIEQKNQLFGLK